MEAVLEGRHLVPEVVAGIHALIAVAAAAGHRGDAGGVHQGPGLLGRQDAVLAVAACAGGRVVGPSLHGQAMHAVRVHRLDVVMADTTGFSHVGAIHPRLGVLRGQDVVAAMAGGTGRRRGVALGHLTAMHTQAIGLHRLGEGDLVLGEELGVGVAGSAGVSQVLAVHRGGRLAAGLDLVGRAMAGLAGGRIGHAAQLGKAMDALRVGLDLVLVAAGAVHRFRLVGVRQAGDAAVAPDASHAAMLGSLEGDKIHLMAGGAVLGRRRGREHHHGHQPSEQKTHSHLSSPQNFSLRIHRNRTCW